MHSDISPIAAGLGIAPEHLHLHGREMAKVSLKALQSKPQRGKLILVSAITPTPAARAKRPSPSAWRRV
jgi:formate--tetrahydrofolate ligase